MALFDFYSNEDVTPETLRRRRALAEQMLGSVGGGANSIGEGLAQLGRAIGGRIVLGRVNRLEKQKTGGAYDWFGGLVQGGSAAPAVTAAPATAPTGASIPIATGTQPGRQPLDMSGLNKSVVDLWGKTQGAFGQPVNIVSAYRDPARNAKAGGAKHSQHMSGNAIDVDVSGMSKADRLRLINTASAMGFTGIGVYNNSLHFDVGNRRAWGPSYHSDSIPGWASAAIGQHMTGKGVVTPAMGPPPSVPAAGQPPEISNAEYLGQFRDAVPPQPAKLAPGFVAPFLRGSEPQITPAAAPPPAPSAVPQEAPPMQRPMSAFERMVRTQLDRGTISEPRPGYTAQQMGWNPFAALATSRPAAGPVAGPSAPAMQPPAMDAAPPQDAPVAATTGQQMPVQQDQGSAKWAAAIASPQFKWLDEDSKKIILQNYQMERERELAASDPGHALDLERKRLEIDALKNPKPKDQPSAVQEYEYAKGQGFGGTFQDWEASKKGGMQLHVDPATGEVTFQQGGNIKPMTESQSKDTTYAVRASGSAPTLDKYGDALLSLGEATGGQIPGVGNFVKSDEYQVAEQAAREFTTAVLRKDSGATITPAEEQLANKTWIPQPGDGKPVLEAKRQARKRAIAAMKAGMTPQAIVAMEQALAQEPAPDAPSGEQGAVPKIRKFNPSTGRIE